MTDVFGRMVADYHFGDLAGQPVYERSDGDGWPDVPEERTGGATAHRRRLDCWAPPVAGGHQTTSEYEPTNR